MDHPPDRSQPRTYTLPDLVAEVADDLERWQEPANGQVRAVPDLRTVRWYSQIGLVDRPLAWRGRTALYGDRHRRQLLAIKRLQGAGLSLDRIQARLLGLDDAALQAVIAEASPDGGQPKPACAGRSAGPPMATAAGPSQLPRRPSTRARFWEQEPSAVAATPLQAILRLDLGAGAQLELPGAALDEASWATLGPALAPLRTWLSRHLPPSTTAADKEKLS